MSVEGIDVDPSVLSSLGIQENVHPEYIEAVIAQILAGLEKEVYPLSERNRGVREHPKKENGKTAEHRPELYLQIYEAIRRLGFLSPESLGGQAQDLVLAFWNNTGMSVEGIQSAPRSPGSLRVGHTRLTPIQIELCAVMRTNEYGDLIVNALPIGTVRQGTTRLVKENGQSSSPFERVIGKDSPVLIPLPRRAENTSA